jgi:hypothetical protein
MVPDKIYVRMCEKFTQWRASEPVEVNVAKLRQCEPPYEGNSDEELLEYLNDEVWNNYEWAETNADVYGEFEAYDLMMEDVTLEEYSDTRDKYADEWLEVGVPNDEYRKVGRFESFADNMSDY